LVRAGSSAQELAAIAIMPDIITIAVERPDQPPIMAMLAELDAYLTAVYPPEANHILDVEAPLEPDIRFFVARRSGIPLGCAALRLESDYGETTRMFVAPSARRVGRCARSRCTRVTSASTCCA
jgi:putative acetyltransferase